MNFVFAGPTIGPASIKHILADAVVCPPARAGDVYEACQRGASSIGLVDGFFGGVPSVWHKEILWAIDQGIMVYGASSMGALRAAELHPFGMIGVGWIFERYVDGTFEDDDEVALAHGPAEVGYAALSQPMVNIRATLAHALAHDILDPDTVASLTNCAKAVHFTDRSWDKLFEVASQKTSAQDLGQAFDWLHANTVDQKLSDAQAMLSALATLSDTPPAQSFEFQHTVMWEALTRSVKDAPPPRETLLVLDLLREQPDLYQDVRQRATAALASHEPVDVPQPDLDRCMTQFRANNRLYTGQAFEAWLEANSLDLAGLFDLFAQDLRRTAMIANNRSAYFTAIMETVEADDAFATLRDDAQNRAARLDQAGFYLPTPEELDINPATLLVWYFEQIAKRAVPDDLDAYLEQNDFKDRSDLEHMMTRAFVLSRDHRS